MLLSAQNAGIDLRRITTLHRNKYNYVKSTNGPPCRYARVRPVCWTKNATVPQMGDYAGGAFGGCVFGGCQCAVRYTVEVSYSRREREWVSTIMPCRNATAKHNWFISLIAVLCVRWTSHNIYKVVVVLSVRIALWTTRGLVQRKFALYKLRIRTRFNSSHNGKFECTQMPNWTCLTLY